MTPYQKYQNTVCFFLLICLPILSFGQMTYEVNAADDVDDGSCNATHCSFREAIFQAYSDQANSIIRFNIPGPGPHYIDIDSVGLVIFNELGYTLDISGKSTDGSVEEIHIQSLKGIDESLGWSGGGSFVLLNAHDDANIEHLQIHATNSACLLMGGQNNTTRFCNFYGENSTVNGVNYTSGILQNVDNANISDCSFFNISNTAIVSTGDFVTFTNNEILGDPVNRTAQGINVQGQQISIIDNNISHCTSGIIPTGKWVNTSDTTHIIIPTDFIYITGNRITEGAKGINLYSTTIKNIFIGDGSLAGANVFGNQEYAGVDAGLIDPDKYIYVNTNYFGIDKITGEEIGNDFGLVCTENIVECEANVFSFNNTGVWIFDHGYQYDNSNQFNSNWIPVYDATNENIDIPIIESVNSHTISGTVVMPMESIHLYYADSSLICQGASYFGTAIVEANGDWSFSTPSEVTLGTKITAISENQDSVSAFTSCWITIPDDCNLAQELTVQKDACNTQGAILDLSLHTDSNTSSNSLCSSSFNGNDAWLKIAVPPSGNVLIRSSIYNTIDPIIEVYRGDCTQLIAHPEIECQHLDSVYFALIIENEPEGEIIYLRIWDRENVTVNNIGVTPLIHITAHEMEADKSLWTVCDLNQFSVDNPSLISERDANKFMLSFEDDVTQAERDQITSELILEGGSLVGSCGCENKVVQLWGNDNPILMEDHRTGATSRPRIDTTAYNYSFEETEFQINIFTTGNQFNPSVAMNSSGDFAVCWSDEIRRHSYLRIYNSSGNPLTSEILIGSPDNIQYESEVTFLNDGNILVVWEDVNPLVGLFTTIVARIFTPEGQALTGIFPISRFAHPELNHNSNFGSNPGVMPASGSDFFVSWISHDEIYTTKVNGTLLQTEGPLFEITSAQIPFNSNTASFQNNNNIIVAHELLLNGNTSVYIQRYNENLALGLPYHAIQDLNASQSKPDVYIFSDNHFALVFQNEANGISSITLGLFDISGNVIAGPITVNTTNFELAANPKISGFENGSFFVSWAGYANGEANIYGQLFDQAGNKINGEDKLSLLSDYDKMLPTTASNKNNLFIAAWEDTGNDGSEKGIFAQRFELENPADPTGYFSLGTATPSSLLGESVDYPNVPNYPLDSLSPVLVSIIDTGVDTGNIFLNPVIWKNMVVDNVNSCYLNDDVGYDFLNDDHDPVDFLGHGTQVNGMIAMNFPSELRLELMNLKVKDQNKGSVFHAICAIYYAIEQGADIINMSWGFEASEPPEILISALKLAAEKDILIVTSAGNTTKNNDLVNKFPSNIDNEHILTVSSYVNQSGDIKLANYASYGKVNVDIAAPGYVKTPSINNQLIETAGTSFSAPIVTRTAAIMKGLFPELTALDIKDCILSTAQFVDELQSKISSSGILDHDAALACGYQKALLCRSDTIFYIDKNHVENSSLQTSASIVSNAVIKEQKDVEYHASESIELRSGFTTQDNVAFFIDVDDCDCELVTNSRFVGVISPWISQQCISQIEADYVKLVIPNATPNFWDVALKQGGFELINGTQYKLSISAKSTTARTIQIKIGETVAPFGSYYFNEINIDSNMVQYDFNFTMSQPSDLDARIELFMGDSTEDVFVERISLIEVLCGN